MSIPLAKLFTKELHPLDQLRGKILAIDIMPWLYKYLFVGDSKEILQSNGVYTSHLKGLLYFIKELKARFISPIICIDGKPPSLKLNEIKKRAESKLKVQEKFKILEDLDIGLDKSQLVQKRNAQIYIGAKEKDTIVQCCQYLGVSYYMMDGVEGEKACTHLKLLGLADACMTPDRDAMIYGTDFYSTINFKEQTVLFYDYKKNLNNLFLENNEDLITSVICTGSDYGTGLKNIGPKKILGLIHDRSKLKQMIKEQIPNFNEIFQLFTSPISLEGLRKEKPDPIKLVEFLKNLNFNEKYILNLCSHLFYKAPQQI